MQHEKKCNMKTLIYKKVQHGAVWKWCSVKKVKHEKSATWKTYNMKKYKLPRWSKGKVHKNIAL